MNQNLKCATCGGHLSGRQRRFCSRTCKNQFTNTKHQNYQAQQARGRRRKLRLVRQFGGKCQECGYRRNFAALEFHHVDPQEKSFQLDLRSLSNRQWRAVLAEAEKCRLLCANCHAETHNPDAFMDASRE